MDPVGYKVVIPARHASTRLPGKPLLAIAGRPMIEHVWVRAGRSAAGEILVATDDKRIAAACRGFGADVVETRADHHSGSDRISEVIALRGWDPQTIVVNVQGDEPCMPPALIDQVAAGLTEHPGVCVATLAYPILEAETRFDPHVVKGVVNVEALPCSFPAPPSPGTATPSRAAGPSSRPGADSSATSVSTPTERAFLPATSHGPPRPWKSPSPWSNCASSATARPSTSAWRPSSPGPGWTPPRTSSVWPS